VVQERQSEIFHITSGARGTQSYRELKQLVNPLSEVVTMMLDGLFKKTLKALDNLDQRYVVCHGNVPAANLAMEYDW
jgi:hypothetical protein